MSAESALHPVDQERAAFRRLLLDNPNYFGNLEASPFKPIKPLVANTSYEQLTCVGYNPRTKFLEATIAIKLPLGYGGNLCMAGTTEYVRFFLDYGSGWEDAGVVGVNVHDIPTGKDCAHQSDKPLIYVASLRLKPRPRCCTHPVLPKVRAILSWEWLPPAGGANAGWRPPWGNTMECHIQIAPRPWSILCLLEALSDGLGKQLKVPPLLEAVKDHPIPLPDPAPFSVAQLAEQYAAAAKGSKGAEAIEAHRFGLPDLHAALSGSGPFVAEAMANQAALWKSMGLDWAGALKALDQTKADVGYEELECLGMDEVLPERLVATFRVKRGLGYSGELCTAGSQEYVAFWADWEDSCHWTHLGTVAVNVHDFKVALPAGGVCYSAILPVDLTYHRRSCSKPKVGRIRAVLSWGVPPSTTNPDQLSHWGNRLDAHVQINPGEVITPGDPPSAKLRNLGGIPIEDIATGTTGMTTPTAQFAHFPGTLADGLGRACPFGGSVRVEGHYYLGYYYRLKVRKLTDPISSFSVLGDSFLVERWDTGFDLQTSTGGFFPYLDPALHVDSTLAVWNTAGDDLWVIQLEIATAPNAASVISTSPWYRIQLDNTGPVEPTTMDIHITSGAGDCKDFGQGTTISGIFIADDLHFGSWSLATEPNTAGTPSNQPTVTGLAATSPAPGPGHAWSMDTANPVAMKPCGYVVRLDVSDRSIVGSQPGSHNRNHIEVGFCLRAKP
jgi:hypothetical protein